MSDKSSPIVGVDIDGCLYPFDVAARTLLALDGVDVPQGDVAEKWNHLASQVTAEEWESIWAKHRREVMDSAPPYPGSIKALHRMEQIARLVLLTHRPRDVAHATMRWLAKYGINPSMLIHASGESKASYVREMHMLAFIDDRSETVREVIEETDTVVWMPRRGWNEDVQTVGQTRSLRFFDDWSDVADWVEIKCSTPRA